MELTGADNSTLRLRFIVNYITISNPAIYLFSVAGFVFFPSGNNENLYFKITSTYEPSNYKVHGY